MEDEEKENEEKQGEDIKETKTITSPVIEEARRENDRKEKLLEKEEALIARRERLHAEQMIGGSSMAGQTTERVPEEVKKLKDAKEFFKGTALEDAISKANE